MKNNFEKHENYIAIFDWYGNKRYYNEYGEYKCEYYPQFDPEKDK